MHKVCSGASEWTGLNHPWWVIPSLSNSLLPPPSRARIHVDSRKTLKTVAYYSPLNIAPHLGDI